MWLESGGGNSAWKTRCEVVAEMLQKLSRGGAGRCSGCQGAGKLLGADSPRANVLGQGRGTVDVRGGCLEGVELRHFKPWVLSFYRAYQVSYRLPAAKQYRAKNSEGCRVVGGVRVKRGVEWDWREQGERRRSRKERKKHGKKAVEVTERNN